MILKSLGTTLGVMALTATVAMSDTVRMGTEGAYPPYNFVNDKGEIDGFERELGDELCARAELECVWVKNEWDSIIPNLVSGNYDTIIAGMSITEERDAVIDFSDAYFPSDPSAYVGLAGADPALINGVVAAQINTIQASHVASSGAQLMEFASPDETVAAVRNGQADTALADKAFWEPIVAESNGELEFVGEDIVLGAGIGVGVRESDGELKAKFNTAIASMKEDGSLNTIIKKWFGEDAATFE
ncbi:amino acid ABC transporter [Amylibacter kogurei]|uniref:Amino acid ABC transporter n=1 Tax=Paramylibacter kogurei TaxID=1889778 RepID=A0A2G5K7C0_9RHOB|nr:transporter substrate-binding domain-containing protein [Amylibacter kogurei]PIB24594.1 amino acid ABC transporter [Amylibacter kogurei]